MSESHTKGEVTKDSTLQAITELTHEGQEHDGFDGNVTAAQIYTKVTGVADVVRTSDDYKAMLSALRELVEDSAVTSAKKSGAGMVYSLGSNGSSKKPSTKAKTKTKAKPKKTSKAKPEKKSAPKPEKVVLKLKRKVRKTLVFNDKEATSLNLSNTVLETVKAVSEQIDEGCTIDLLVEALEQHGMVIDPAFKGKGAELVKGVWTTKRAKLSSQLAWHKSQGNLTGDRGFYQFVPPKEQPAAE